MAAKTGPVLIGLHITKCAGTTLALHVSKKMGPARWYLCSSPYGTAMDGRQELAERLNLDRINFVFGHYVHESLNAVFANRNVFWFTGIREPIDRAISEYYHICSVRALSGQPPLSAADFLAVRSNTMCLEFLRAFPTIDQQAGGTLAERAGEVAVMFDLIYGSTDFEATIDPIVKRLGIDLEGLVSTNTRTTREEDAAYLREQAEVIGAAAESHFSEDIALYLKLKPLIGRWQPFAGDAHAMARRAEWLAKMTGTPEAGLARFATHLSRLYVHDFVNIGRTADLQTLLRRRQDWLDAVRSVLDERLAAAGPRA